MVFGFELPCCLQVGFQLVLQVDSRISSHRHVLLPPLSVKGDAAIDSLSSDIEFVS